MRLITLTSAFLLGALALPCVADSDWKLEKDSDNVQVFTRAVEGSPLKEFKGITTITTSLTSLVALMDDREVSPTWIKDNKEGALIEKVDDSLSYSYNVTAAPWPVKDRDMVIKSVTTQDADTLAVRIELNAEKEGKPEQKGRVRVTEMNGHWAFVPKEGGAVEVTYQLHADPAGKLPNWLINSMVVDMPFHTLKNMQTKVLEDKYQQAQLSSIKNVE